MRSGTKLGLIGCGVWGRNLARVMARLGVLNWVTDLEPDSASQFAGDFGVASVSLNQMLAANDLDGIVVATPAATHDEMAVAGLAAGKHVYIEKPLSQSLDGAQATARAARAANRHVMTGHLLRYHPAFVALSKAFRDGAIGRLRHIHASRLVLPHQRNTNSVIFDLLPHDVSLVLALAQAEPHEIVCTGASLAASGFVDSLDASLTFTDGVTASLQCSRKNSFKEQRLVVSGSSGMLVFDDTRPWHHKLTLFQEIGMNGQSEPIMDSELGIGLPLLESEPLKSAMRAFVQVCETGLPALCDLDEALRVQSVLETLSLQCAEPEKRCEAVSH